PCHGPEVELHLLVGVADHIYPPHVTHHPRYDRTMSRDELWDAPSATGPIRARVTVPGSKSATNRALVLAALADGPSTLFSPLRSRDTLLMAGALRVLGAHVDDGVDGSWLVTPVGKLTGDTEVDMGAAGTVMRFVP